MKKLLLLLFMLFSIFFYSPAQNKHWQWAKTGGATDVNTANASGGSWFYDDYEHIKFIETDHHGNTYAVGTFSKGKFGNDTILTHYNFNPTYRWASRNAVIFKLDCEGNMKWYYPVATPLNNHHASPLIDGFGIDSLGGVYLSMRVGGDYITAGINPIDATIRTSTNPTSILKLDTMGNFQWIKLSYHNNVSIIDKGFSVESDGTLHRIFNLNDFRSTIDNGLISTDSATWSQKDMIILRYDKDGNYIDYVLPPVKSLFKSSGASKIYFKYDEITSHYYIYGYLWSGSVGQDPYGFINGDTIWGFNPDWNGNDVNLHKLTQSYIAAFDYGGNYLWHKKNTSGTAFTPGTTANGNIFYSISKGVQSQCRYLSINTNNELQIIARLENFGNYQLDSLKERVIKIDINSNLLWQKGFPTDTSKYYPLVVTANNSKVGVMGQKNIFYNYNGLWYNTSQSLINQWFFDELDSETGALQSRNIWQSELNHTGKSAYINTPVSMTTDRWGNYIAGGAVGTRFYLENGSILLDNTSTNNETRDAQLFIGKFGAYDCDGNIIDSTGMSVEPVYAEKEELIIYPNPAKNELRIKNYELGDGKDIEIYDVLGKLYRPIIRNSSIVISSLNSGVYFLKIGARTGKFIKE